MAGRLVAQNITKRFGQVTALDSVSIEFSAGEVHAVLGENGAGKSTLMHVLAGFMLPQEGTVSLDGKPLHLGKPHRCREAGVEMVHQHFTLVPNFTVEENLALAKMGRLAQILNVSRLAATALDMGRQLGWNVDPKAKVGSLSVGVQQRIEILKCLSGDASVLIFDEPTAVLTPDEVLDLIRVLKELKARNKIVILIAHKLSEVMAVADRVTVLRAGKKVSTAPIANVDEATLANWMVGEMPPISLQTKTYHEGLGLSATAIRVLGDRREASVRGVTLNVAPGEILGIGGVDGNGQIELAEALAHVRPITDGHLRWNGQPIERHLRIAYIPQDRQEDGLALPMSVEDNLMIEGQHRPELKKGMLQNVKAVARWCDDLIARFDIRVSSRKQPVADLSGGNQQKVVVSRNLDRRPDFLVAVNPTRGLDVRATRFVHEQIKSAREAGTAVALFSTDLDELAALSDRIVYMSRGELSENQSATALVGGSK